MPLASSGALLSSLGREAVASVRNIPNSRAFHLYTRNVQTASTAQRLIHHGRSLLQAFVGHLTTPGTLGHQGPARSLHHLTRGQTIQSRLSLPARHALSRPFGAPKLPRPPSVPRSVFQVGLGTARKFSTGRPIFAHLAENVPVTGRAFIEADWNLRTEEEKGKFTKENSRAKKVRSRKVKTEKVEFHPAAQDTAASTQPNAAELEHYFPSVSTPEVAPGVTTTLLIPLAPTPSSRMPLQRTPKLSDAHPIVPFVEMSSLHYDFARHNDRVAALFERLDRANVWDSGAKCNVYGDSYGDANVLRVAFTGWDAKRVRAIIGETGSGWCMLEEERELDDTELDEALSALDTTSRADSPLSSLSGSRAVSPPPNCLPAHPLSSCLETPPALADFGVSIDPSQSFVLPTLDFSSAFEASSGYVSDESELSSLLESDLQSDGDGESVILIEPFSASIGEAPTHNSSWLGFSSIFSERMQEGPMEDMF